MLSAITMKKQRLVGVMCKIYPKLEELSTTEKNFIMCRKLSVKSAGGNPYVLTSGDVLTYGAGSDVFGQY